MVTRIGRGAIDRESQEERLAFDATNGTIASLADRESQNTFSDAIQIDSDWCWLCALFLLAIPVPVPFKC